MSTDTDMWLAFARTFGMLFVVLAFFLAAFYFFRRFAAGTGAKGAGLINVLAVHHVSPKEKLILVNVLEQNILIGVTPQSITSLAALGAGGAEVTAGEQTVQPGFSDLLKKTLKKASRPAPLSASDPDGESGDRG